MIISLGSATCKITLHMRGSRKRERGRIRLENSNLLNFHSIITEHRLAPSPGKHNYLINPPPPINFMDLRMLYKHIKTRKIRSTDPEPHILTGKGIAFIPVIGDKISF